jgi:hypothetical protein
MAVPEAARSTTLRTVSIEQLRSGKMGFMIISRRFYLFQVGLPGGFMCGSTSYIHPKQA